MLEESRFEQGVWQGRVAAQDEPRLSVMLDGQPVGPVRVEPDGDGQWRVAFDVPPAALSEGAHVFLIEDADRGTRLGAATLIAGAGLDADFRAELAALRAEVEVLKRVIRRLHGEQGD